MGYACPVCEAPQADGEHLANHLAFTAMLHDDEHADFLDARVDDWEDRTPPELAAELIHLADETEYDQVFEDTTDGPGMGHGSGTSVDHLGGPEPHGDDAPVDVDALEGDTVDAETERVIEEARKLFEQGEDPVDEE